MSGIELLERLCLAFGPTGCECEVREIIRETIDGLCDEIYEDRLGNLIALVKGSGDVPRGKLLVAAHTDEVGFMITHIEDSGMIRLSTIGIDSRVLCGRRVTIGNDVKNGCETKRVNGIISSKAIHLQSPDERSRVTKADEMYIDIGARDKADAEKYVAPGDYGTFSTDFKRLGGGYILAKAVDDRFGCAVMCDTIRRLKDSKPERDVYFAFTVREETGLSGARVAAFELAPDEAIVLESTAVADIAGVPEHLRVAETGKGGAISLMDRSTIYQDGIVSNALETAKKHCIPVQLKKYVSGGNDAGAIHRSRDGIPTLAMSAPTRFIHSASTVFAECDLSAVTELLEMLIKCPERTDKR